MQQILLVFLLHESFPYSVTGRTMEKAQVSCFFFIFHEMGEMVSYSERPLWHLLCRRSGKFP